MRPTRPEVSDVAPIDGVRHVKPGQKDDMTLYP